MNLPESVSSRSDVVVIGGGLLGCAASYYLARAGARVVLLEREQLNRQASGQNAGSLHFQLEHRMIEHGDALAEQFALSIPLVQDAVARWSNLEVELGEDLEILQDGGFIVAETRDEIQLLEKKRALESKWNLETELLTGDEARRMAPYLSKSIQAAGYYSKEGHANPRLVAPALARAAIRLGAELSTNQRVNYLGRRRGRWTVRTESGLELETETVLVTAGAWTGRVAALANVNLPVIPVALSMMATESVSPTMTHLVQHVGRRLSMKQMRDGNVLIGGGWPAWLRRTENYANIDDSPGLLLDSLAGSAALASHVVPAVRSLRLIRTWSGIVGVTPDQIPVLGEVHRRPGLFVAIGGSGFTIGLTYAHSLSEQILKGEASLPMDLYSPQRLDHLNPV